MQDKVVKHSRVERWTARRKSELVLDIIKGRKTVVDAARQYDLKQSEIQQWIDTFVNSGTHALKSNPRKVESAYESQLKAHREKIGELVLQIDVLKKAKSILEEGEEENLCSE